MESRGALVRAVRVSTALLPFVPARGRVLGVHRSAVNLAIGDRLITIASAAAGGLPGGIGVAADFAPRALGLVPGMPVVAEPAELRFGSGAAIRLEDAVPWSPALAATPLPADLPRRVRVLRSVLDHAGRDGFGGLLAARTRIAHLETAARQGDVGALAVAGEALVGLGAGLTPAGDDLLVGLSAALTAAGDPAAGSLATRWAGCADGRTTPVAVAYHRHAAAGEYAQSLHDLLRAVLRGGDAAMATAAARVTRVGATSGVDTLQGVTFGLETVASRSQARAAA